MNRLVLLSLLLFAGLSATATTATPSAKIDVYPNLAADFCDNPTELATCDVPPLLGTFTITVAPGDYVHLTVPCENTGTTSLVNHDVDIPDLGAVGASPASILPGRMITFRAIFRAPVLPGRYSYVVVYEAEDDLGNPVVDTSPLIIEVAAPTAEVSVELHRAADVCTDPSNVSTCDFPDDGTNNLVIASGHYLYVRAPCRNTSQGSLLNHRATIPGLGEIGTVPTNILPGSSISFREVFPAPLAPGRYNYRVRYTAEDTFGNPLVVETPFVVEVITVSAGVSIEVYLAEDQCSDVSDPESCQSGTGGNGAITSGTGQPLYVEVPLVNTGSVPLRNGRVDIPGLGSFPGPPAPVAPGETAVFRTIFPAPATDGTHPFTATYTAETTAGYPLSQDLPLSLTARCLAGDFVPPTVTCQDFALDLQHRVSATISAADLNATATDNCDAAPNSLLDQTTFTCADLGERAVKVTGVDAAGNRTECTATVTVTSAEHVSLGPVDQCMTVVEGLARHGFVDVLGPEGRLIASVDKRNNAGVAAVRIDLYREAAAVIGGTDDLRLSRRLQFIPLDATGATVVPNNPIGVRLYYRDQELAALATASGAERAAFQLVRSQGDCDDDGLTGTVLPVPNTQYGNRGCLGENHFYETNIGGNDILHLFANPAALPVSLTAFTATAEPKDRVRLHWTTSTETDNDRFLVEHSTDGITFTQVGAVAGAGSVLTEHRYTFLDEAPVPGRNYYRLRQVDFDGTFQLSEVRQVNIKGQGQLVPYPNPAGDLLHLPGFAGGPVRVLDLRGRLVLSHKLALGQPLRVGSVARGIYLLRTPSGTVKWVKE
ncbi:MAG: T9SS type A sorting domain-containing protein [Bacteroidota bacterium]